MENFYERMESERARIPNIGREEFIPIFVVKCLREKLSPDSGDSDDIEAKDNLEFNYKKDKDASNKYKMKIPFLFGKSSLDQDGSTKWSDNTLLEENPDFEGEFLLTLENLNFVGRILTFANDALSCFGVHKNKIGKQFADEFECPSIELLYLMDVTYNVMAVESYLMWLKDAAQIKYFKQQFLAFAFSSHAFAVENRERSNRILEHFLQCLILAYYCNSCSKTQLVSLKQLAGNILKEITAKLICDDNSKVETLNHRIVLSMLKDVNIPKSVRSRYFSEHIGMILTSETEPSRSGRQILQCQEKLADPVNTVRLENFNETVSEMFKSVLSTSDIINVISTTLDTNQFEWERVLSFITVWIKERQSSASSAIKELIKTKIRKGLLEKEEEDVLIGFILARHCSLVASPIFSRYEKWFTNTFESEMYSPANDADTFMYLSEVLTDWIPMEPNCFLHVHTTFRPFIPKGCRDKWNDYLAVAKVRILEYKEIEEAMEFEPNLNDPIQHDVAMTIKAYEASGKIPQNIHKMWVIRKQHYLNNFLPALLRKPANIAQSDARLRLIELLRKEGKIPRDDMYANYKASLKQA